MTLILLTNAHPAAGAFNGFDPGQLVEVHLFDAKLKLRRLEAGDRAEYELRRESTLKEEDLHKMHAYRDAIAGARSAWALYPGSSMRFHATSGIFAKSAESLPTLPLAGMGALPLLPEPEGQRTLRGVLARLRAPPASATILESQRLVAGPRTPGGIPG